MESSRFAISTNFLAKQQSAKVDLRNGLPVSNLATLNTWKNSKSKIKNKIFSFDALFSSKSVLNILLNALNYFLFCNYGIGYSSTDTMDTDILMTKRNLYYIFVTNIFL